MKTFIIAVIAVVASLFSVSAEQMTIQPGSVDGKDMWLSTSYNKTAVDSVQLVVGGCYDTYMSFIQFNINSAPALATSANLYLYSISSQTPMDVYVNGMSWSETGTKVTDSLYGQKFMTTGMTGMGQWLNIDIKTAYGWWKNGSRANNGLALLPVYNNNRFNYFASSDHWFSQYRPKLVLTYIKLKYPLANATRPNVGGYHFGVLWKENGNNGFASDNKTKFLHTGIDLVAKAGDSVYATSNGWIRYASADSKWGGYVIIEHTLEDGQKYTTCYIHVIPALYGSFPVSKGQKIATIAYGNIYYNPHLHFQVRLNGYDTSNNVSDRRGALPEKAIDGFLAFPEYFIDPLTKVVWE